MNKKTIYNSVSQKESPIDDLKKCHPITFTLIYESTQRATSTETLRMGARVDDGVFTEFGRSSTYAMIYKQALF